MAASNFWQRCQVWAKDKSKQVESWLREGADPTTLAISAGVGFSLGLCPVLGVSTLLCLGALVVARWLRVELHSAMALLANLVSVPVEVRSSVHTDTDTFPTQLALILPHMRVGEFVTGSPHMQVVKIHLSDLWKGHLAGDLLVGRCCCRNSSLSRSFAPTRVVACHPWLAAAGGIRGSGGGSGDAATVSMAEAAVCVGGGCSVL